MCFYAVEKIVRNTAMISKKITMTKISLRKFLTGVACLFVFGMAWPMVARADCPTTMGLPQSFDYGSVAIPNTLAVGDVIPGTVRTFRIVGTCAASTTFSKDVVTCPAGGAVSGLTGVYATGRAGVGMRMRNSAGTPLVGTGQCATTSSLGKTDSTGHFDVSGSFELVKTGVVAAGTIGSASYSSGVLNSGVALNNNNGSLSVPSGTQLRAVTCSVVSGSENQTVVLPTVTAHALGTVGATAGTTPFQIKMSCAPDVRVNITLQSVSGDSGVNSVLGSTGTSSGVGIQVLDATHTAITLNEIHEAIDSTTGDMTIYFYAQYYRLAATIKPGLVNAAAIYTMSYQ
jgi:type 1 fimbria pilin